MTEHDKVERLRRFGYNPIHIIGHLYIARYKSKLNTKVSIYLPCVIKDDEVIFSTERITPIGKYRI